MPEALRTPAGGPRSRATCPDSDSGGSPRNKGQGYPADPPTVAEIVTVMRHAGHGLHAARVRALIVVLWRAGLRIHEVLALGEGDPDERRGSLLVCRGKGGRRREVGMDDWARERLTRRSAPQHELGQQSVGGPYAPAPTPAGAPISSRTRAAARVNALSFSKAQNRGSAFRPQSVER